MSAPRTAIVLGGGAAALLVAALWLVVSVFSRPPVEEARTPPDEKTAPSLPPPSAPVVSAPPAAAPTAENPAEKLRQMAELKEEMGRVVQGIHSQLAAGRPTGEVLADLRRIRAQYRQRLGTQGEVAAITMEELEELEQQLLLRAHAQGQR